MKGPLTDVGSATDAASSPSTPSAPTVTGTTTTTVTISDTTVINSSLPVLTASLAHHDASETSEVQTIARETTTNVTTPYTRTVTTVERTVTTYSDSSTTTTDSSPTSTSTLINVVDTTVTNDSFSGRIDQDQKLADLNQQLDRSLNMDVFRRDGAKNDDVTVYINGAHTNSNMSKGYNSTSQGFGMAAEKQINPDWRLGIQGNRIATKMDGVDSNTRQNKDHVGLFSAYDIEGFTIVNNLGHSMNSGRTNRSIAGIDFNNSHDIKSTDTWLNNRVYIPEIEGFRPFAGVTVGQSKVDGYTESGSIQSARTVAGKTNSYSYGEAGVRVDKKIDDFRIAGEVGRTTDSITTGTVSLGYAPNKDSLVSLGVNYQNGNNIESTTVSLKGVIRF